MKIGRVSVVVTVIAFLLVAMLFAAPASAQLNKGDGKSAQDSAASTGVDSGPLRVTNMIDKSVEDKQGNELGKIDDVVIGPDGRAEFIVISHGGILGIGEKLVPVPWKSVMATPRVDEGGNFVAAFDSPKLDNAPNFTRNDWPDLAGSEWLQSIYSYYGEARSGSREGGDSAQR